jgi:hypothetical protein
MILKISPNPSLPKRGKVSAFAREGNSQESLMNHDFIDNYVENLKRDNIIKYEHKLTWNEIVSQQQFDTQIQR